VAQRRFFVRRRLKFTREGKYFVALSLGIGFAAINTGNNLLFLVLGMMLALILASGILSELALVGLDVTRRVPDRIFAGQPILIGIRLNNSKRRLPSFSIEVQDQVAASSPPRTCYFLKVPAARAHEASYRHVFPRRGLYRLSSCQLSTKFPFGLFRKSLPLECPFELLVYPTIRPLSVSESAVGQQGECEVGRLGRQGEFHDLRQYQSGDDPRSIHWRKSASLGRLMVRQNEDQGGRHVGVFLDNWQPGVTASPAEVEQQEAAVSLAASLAAHYLRQGYTVRLCTRTESVGPGRGESHLTQMLRVLALIEFSPSAPAVASLPRWEGEWVTVEAVSAP